MNIKLRVDAKGNTYDFLYALDRSAQWRVLAKGIDAIFLSTKKAGGFVGSMYGMYTTSLGRESVNKAYFDWFSYQGDDDIYKD